MYQADLYIRHNNLQRRDIKKVLNNSFNLIKWSHKEEMVLDIGCGSGDVTKDVLLPLLPTKCKGIVGVDLSTDMLEYAKKHNSNEKILYKQMDLAQRAINNEFVGCFEHAFSFHVFHWIKDQKQLFANIFEMLKPGGDVLALFVLNTDVMLIYEKMSQMLKWAPYLQNVYDIFPYHFCSQPLKALECILDQVGFSHLIKVEKKEFVYSSKEEFKTSMAVINPFIKNVPEKCHEDFMSDFAQIAQVLNFFAHHAENGDVIVPYNLAVLYLRKPE